MFSPSSDSEYESSAPSSSSTFQPHQEEEPEMEFNDLDLDAFLADSDVEDQDPMDETTPTSTTSLQPAGADDLDNLDHLDHLDMDFTDLVRGTLCEEPKRARPYEMQDAVPVAKRAKACTPHHTTFPQIDVPPQSMTLEQTTNQEARSTASSCTTSGSLQCHITQGTVERQHIATEAWLRSMNRLSYCNLDLELGQYTHLAEDIAEALVAADNHRIGVAITPRLLYADTSEPVPLKSEGSTQENVALISRKGTAKYGSQIFHHQEGIHLVNTRAAPDMATLPTSDFLEVCPRDGALHLSYKFSSNVTSRRHGMRGKGRRFCWEMVVTLRGIQAEPIEYRARSHEFEYVSRPQPQSVLLAKQSTEVQLSTLPVVSVVDVVSDFRLGDVFTCVGEELHHDNVVAQLGFGDTVLATVFRERPSKVAFIGRFPRNVVPGTYWLQMAPRAAGVCQASARWHIDIVA